MSDASVDNVQEFIDRQAIQQVMMRYCHGVDRCDLEVLQGSFWEDGACDYGSGELNAMEWAVGTHAGISAMVRTFHSISNNWIEVDGDSATSETYCTAYHVIPGEDGTLTDMIVGGRYLDHHEKRGNEWRIKHRLYVMDWNQNVPNTDERSEGMLGGLNTGSRMPEDQFYSFTK